MRRSRGRGLAPAPDLSPCVADPSYVPILSWPVGGRRRVLVGKGNDMEIIEDDKLPSITECAPHVRINGVSGRLAYQTEPTVRLVADFCCTYFI